jgi:hypothetical protein
MCVIVDNDVVARVLIHDELVFRPLKKSVYDGRHKLVHGGKLTREYVKNATLRSLLVTLDKVGLSRVVSSNEVDAKTDELVQGNACESNDEHVIALALVGRVRLLCTGDLLLTRDFKNKDLINKPRGTVYGGAKAGKLVERKCKCVPCTRT